MKILFYFLFFISFSVQAQTYVPDDNFEQALIDLGYDDILDDYVVTENINSITSLAINDKNISSIEGIEDFTMLEYLNCEHNVINEFDLSYNASLEYLFCSGNNLTSINVEINTNLKLLNCAGNPVIFLDLSNNTSLETIDCIGTNVQYIDIRNGNNENISTFYAINNPNLSCIYVDDSSASFLPFWWIDENTHFVETELACESIGVDELNSATINLYPNPTNKSFIVQGLNNIIEISIFNLNGSLIKYNLIDNNGIYILENIESGVYFVKIKTPNNYLVEKLIVK